MTYTENTDDLMNCFLPMSINGYNTFVINTLGMANLLIMSAVPWSKLTDVGTGETHH